MKRLRWIVRGLVAALLLLAIMAGVLLWRASRAPIGLGPFENTIRQAIAETLPGLGFDSGEISAQWDAGDHLVRVSIKNIRLGEPELATPIVIADLRLDLLQNALLTGRVRPVLAHIEGLRGAYDWRLRAGSETPSGFDYAALHEAIRKGWDAFRFNPMLRRLEAVEIADAAFDLRETESGVAHRLTSDRLRLMQSDGGYAFEGLMRVSRGGHGVAQVNMQAKGQAVLEFEGGLTADNAAALSAGLPLDGWENAIDMQAGLTFAWTLAEEAAQDRIRISLKTGKGRLAQPRLYDAPRSVKSVMLTAMANPQAGDLTVAGLDLRFGGVRFSGKVQVAGAWSKTPAIAMTGRFEGLDVARLKRYWPSYLGAGGREWVAENIEAGVLPNATVAFNMAAEDWAADGAMPVSALSLDFDLKNIKAHYRRPMPPLIGAAGHGRLNLNGLTLDIASGDINGLLVEPSRVKIGPFTGHPQYADIQLAVSGDAERLLEVVDSEPLGYITAYGFKPSDLSGKAAAEVALRFPLLKSLSFDQVVFKAGVKGKNLAMPSLLGHGGLTEADLDFSIDGDGLHAAGPAHVMGVPVEAEWSESFKADTAQPTRLSLVGHFTEADLKRWDLDLGNRFRGSAGFNLTTQGRGEEISSGRISFDLLHVRMAEPFFGWAKPDGAPGRLGGDFRVEEGIVKIDNADLKAEGLDSQFSFRLNPENNKTKVDIANLKLGESILRGTVAYDQERWHILLNGPQLDLRPFIAWIYAPSQAEGNPTSLLPDITASVSVEKVLLANEETLQDLSAEIKTSHDLWQTVDMSGALGDGKPFVMQIETKDQGRSLHLSAKDAGRAARGMDLFAQGEGGDLELNADLTGSDERIAIDGLATMTDFRIRKAPTLARLLSVGSLTGIADLVRGGGIEFRQMHLPFSMRDGVIDIADASANGPALGLTASGQFVKSLARADLKGVIVPAFTLNSFIGKIPLIGEILAGGDKEGVFGINYHVEGNLTEPEISVNPMSMLTPGILRRIIQGPRGEVESDLPPEDAPPAATGDAKTPEPASEAPAAPKKQEAPQAPSEPEARPQEDPKGGQ